MGSFWPATFVEWVQVAAPLITLGAVGVALRSTSLAIRWRHEDFVGERSRLAAMIIGEIKLLGTIGADELKIGSVVLYNASSEPIKDIRFTTVGASGDDLNIRHGGDVKAELLLIHLPAGDVKTWKNITHSRIPLTQEGGRRRPIDSRTCIEWTDAAGWRWRAVGNESPIQISPKKLSAARKGRRRAIGS